MVLVFFRVDVPVFRVEVDFLLDDFLVVPDLVRVDVFLAGDFFVVFLRAVEARFVVLRRARRFFGINSFLRKLRSPGFVSTNKIKRNIAIKTMMFPG